MEACEFVIYNAMIEMVPKGSEKVIGEERAVL